MLAGTGERRSDFAGHRQGLFPAVGRIVNTRWDAVQLGQAKARVGDRRAGNWFSANCVRLDRSLPASSPCRRH